MRESEIRENAEYTAMTGDMSAQMANIRVAMGALTRNLDNALGRLHLADCDTRDLTTTYYAIEYAEGTAGEDIRRHLADASRSIRAALALHKDAARITDPPQVQAYLAQPDGFDSLLAFADEEQRDRYAALFPDTETGTAPVLGNDAAEKAIDEAWAEMAQDQEV